MNSLQQERREREERTRKPDSDSPHDDTERDICSIGELESIFKDQEPVKFLVEPELPERSLVMVAGESEAGKTTLACAWARDLVRRRHAVLILDRDGNPRERIRDRFIRLGISEHEPLLSVWDCEQRQEPPLPNAPIIEEWVEQMVAESGLTPLVIVDSLVSNLADEESENNSTDMRRAIARCRRLTRLGATVLILHHVGHNGKIRGSSDIRPSVDQAFIVTNRHPDGLHLLCDITLSVEKTRYGLAANLVYRYADGAMVKDPSWRATIAPPHYGDALRDILIANPGITSSRLESLSAAGGISKSKVREWLSSAKQAGQVTVETGDRNAHHHTWAGKVLKKGRVSCL